MQLQTERQKVMHKIPLFMGTSELIKQLCVLAVHVMFIISMQGDTNINQQLEGGL